MNKSTKIALGLCAVKVGLEVTKYISEKWGNGEMKKDIEKFEKYVIDFANTKVEAVRETIKQVGAAGTEIAKQTGECARLKEQNNRESEKEIIETIERLRKDNEDGKNDEDIEFFKNLLLEKQKTREERNNRREKEETEKRKAREKAREREMYMNYGLGAIVFIGTALLVREAIIKINI